MKCNNCGNICNTDSLYCNNCGYKLNNQINSPNKRETIPLIISIINLIIGGIIILPFTGIWLIFGQLINHEKYQIILLLCITYLISSIIALIMFIYNKKKKGTKIKLACIVIILSIILTPLSLYTINVTSNMIVNNYNLKKSKINIEKITDKNLIYKSNNLEIHLLDIDEFLNEISFYFIIIFDENEYNDLKIERLLLNNYNVITDDIYTDIDFNQINVENNYHLYQTKIHKSYLEQYNIKKVNDIYNFDFKLSYKNKSSNQITKQFINVKLKDNYSSKIINDKELIYSNQYFNIYKYLEKDYYYPDLTYAYLYVESLVNNDYNLNMNVSYSYNSNFIVSRINRTLYKKAIFISNIGEEKDGAKLEISFTLTDEENNILLEKIINS